jgi:short-subunit dehydrogenase
VTRGHAIVVGASSGIGLAIATRLTAEGYRVSGLSRRAAPKVAAERSFPCDLLVPGDAERALGLAMAESGTPSVLVFAAGYPTMGRTLDVPPAEARRAFDVNFWGLDAAVRVVLPPMIARGEGNILAVSTIAALRSLAFEAYYGASKAAVVRYMGSVDRETRKLGVRAKCLGVGFVDTGFFERGGWYGMARPSVRGSGLRPEDVAEQALRMLREEEGFRLVGWRERLIALGDRIAPSLYDRWTSRRDR